MADRSVFTTDKATELWISDGTPSGTAQLASFANAQIAAIATLRQDIVFEVTFAAGGTSTIFISDDPEQLFSEHSQLWASNGTPSGTHLIADINPGGGIGTYYEFNDPHPPEGTPSPAMLPLGNELLFAADDGAHGYEPWVTNGTQAGTHMLADVNPGPDGSSLGTYIGNGLGLSYTALGGLALFPAYTDASGWQLWSTDGTSATQLTDIEPALGGINGYGANIGVSGSLAAFGVGVPEPGPIHYAHPVGYDPTAPTIVTDGTPAGTHSTGQSAFWGWLGGAMIFDQGSNPFANPPPPLDYTLLAVTPQGGATTLHDFGPENITNLGSDAARILFAVHQATTLGTADVQLWATDGTPSGTVLLRDFGNQPAGAFEREMGVLNAPAGTLGDDVLFQFHPGQGEPSNQLWASNGTAAGTKPLYQGPGTIGPELGTLGDVALFTVGYQVWTTDGTTAGTRAISPTFAIPIGQFTIAGGEGWFWAESEASGPSSLWETDGTTVTQIAGSEGLEPGPVAFGDNVEFLANGTDYVVQGASAVPVGTLDGAVITGSFPAPPAPPAVVIDSPGGEMLDAPANATIFVGGSEGDLVFGGGYALAFINGAGASTVLGGAGGASMFGGAGGGVFFGSANGFNLLVGGAGRATIGGGGNGDQLWAGGSAGDVLAAASGNETLGAGSSTGPNVFFGGSGNDLILAGAGNDLVVAGPGTPTIFAGATGNTAIFAGSAADLLVLGGGADYVQFGTGNATAFAGSGADLFGVYNGQADGSDVISGFKNGADHIALRDYAAAPNVVAQGGNTVITLSDNTQIALLGVSGLAPNTFV